MKKRFFCGVFYLSSMLLFSTTQVSISSSTNSATIGDKIELKILVKTSLSVDNINTEIENPKFEIISQKEYPFRQHKDSIVFEKSIIITFFKIGDFEIGPFSVELKNKARIVETKTTNTIPIKIQSVLSKNDKDIKELKNLIEIGGNPFYILKYAIIILISLFIIIAIIFFIKKRGQKIKSIQMPWLSPLEEFETKLRELKEKKMFEKGKIKEFFIQLTMIIKIFLNREYLFNAEDFTTHETLDYLFKKEKEILILDNTEFILKKSDLVKFAKFIPNQSELNEIENKILKLVSIIREKRYSQFDTQK